MVMDFLKKYWIALVVAAVVLAAVLGVILVSCNNDDEPEATTTADDGAWITPPPTTTMAPVTTNPPVSTSKPSTDYTWTDDTASTPVYIRIDAVNVRSDTIVNENTKVGTAKFGESYTRVKYNDQWTMISYNGQNRYISTAYVTTDKGSVVFTEVAEKTMYVNVEATLFLRTSTYTKNPDETRYEDNIYSSVKRGVAVTQIGVSSNGLWAKVKFEDRVLYCNTAYLSETVPSDDTSVKPAPTPTPVG